MVICSLGPSHAGSVLYVVNNFVFLKQWIFCYSSDGQVSQSSDLITLFHPYLNIPIIYMSQHSKPQCFESSNPLCGRAPCLAGYQACREAIWRLSASVVAEPLTRNLQGCIHTDVALAFVYLATYQNIIWRLYRPLLPGHGKSSPLMS